MASEGLVEREFLLEMTVLAAVAGEHLLVIGPPGTAKSEAVRRVAGVLGGKYFEYLLGRFTEPSELFGPINLKKLREGIVETETEGMLPEAEIAFLDEVFQGSTAILNTLLGILNERVFLRGHTRISCPLRVCVGASNQIPEDESLEAFADRFLIRVFLEPISDVLLEELLAKGWTLRRNSIITSSKQMASLKDLDELAVLVQSVDVSTIRNQLAEAIRLLRKAGLSLSDRRIVRSQRLIAAAAVTAGRCNAEIADFWPLVYVLPSREEQDRAREVLGDILSASENFTLPAAAEEASKGALAAAERLIRHAEEQFVLFRAEQSEEIRLKLEGIAREIDSTFSPENITEKLSEIRGEIIALLGTTEEPKDE
jgi:MoxR-like ATPase